MTPLSLDELVALDPPRSAWGRKLHGLAVRVIEGRDNIGEFHRIGQFDTPHRARDIERRLENNTQLIPKIAAFELRTRRLTDGDGNVTRSELWARVTEIHHDPTPEKKEPTP